MALQLTRRAAEARRQAHIEPMSKKGCLARGALVRFGVAGLLGWTALWCGASPAASRFLGPHTASAVFRILDMPASGFNLLLPPQIRSGFAWQFTGGTYCFPRSFLTETAHYLAVAVPPWMFLLYLPLAIGRALRRDQG